MRKMSRRCHRLTRTRAPRRSAIWLIVSLGNVACVPGVGGSMQRRFWSALVIALACCGPPAKPAEPPHPAPPPLAPLPAEQAAKPAPIDPMTVVTPLDPQIKLGHLKNGLTYYVMKHKKPEQRAALWLAVNA